MKAHDVFDRRWLHVNDTDLDEPIVLEIALVRTVTFADSRWTRALSFAGYPRQLKLNRTRFQDIAAALGENDDEFWLGRRIEIYRGHAFFKGRPVPSIRCRAPGGEARDVD